MSLWMSVDPGVSGLGWAWWKDGFLMAHGNLYPEKTATDWYARADSIDNQFSRLLFNYEVETVHIEFPEYHTGAVGHAASTRGDTLVLAYLCGLLRGSVRPRPVHFVTPSQWKGQLPKAVVEYRIKERIPGCKAKAHALDAIGIGLFVQGRF